LVGWLFEGLGALPSLSALLACLVAVGALPALVGKWLVGTGQPITFARMRKVQIFVGSSHPDLGGLICKRLDVEPAPCRISAFSNGETACDIGVSVRDTHAIIIIGAANQINDKIMESLILVSGCRGGSASRITCVMPMFPYSKQSKMKKHRGAITARMLANLLVKAGADHIITMDLHASQMQGFFSVPVDNLSAGPTLARWIRENVPDYEESVIVSKNPGGTKRVTSLADALKVNFAMIHTDRRRRKFSAISAMYPESNLVHVDDHKLQPPMPETTLRAASPSEDAEENEEKAGNIHIARVLKGHVVKEGEEDAANGAGTSTETAIDSIEDEAARGDNDDDVAVEETSDDEEVDYSKEQVIALVGDVRGRTAILLDDMIDRPDSFIAAAEHCVLSCGAKSVIVIATHGNFSAGSLQALDASPYIHRIVVTNTYPIYEESPKLTVIDISHILAECVRRTHNGESISTLFDQLAII